MGSVFTMSSLSTEYVRVPVQAKEAGVVVDPTGSTVEFAAVVSGEPETDDWATGTWETDGAQYYARVLIGPAGGVLNPGDGTWNLWIRITDSPERPVEKVGVIKVT